MVLSRRARSSPRMVISCAVPGAAVAQTTPPRGPDEGKGPFNKLVIRGVNVIDGSGGTVQGPRDIVIQSNRITEIRSAGTPGLPMEPNRPPRDVDHEIDATGMWVMPGLVDEHVHAAAGRARRCTYAYKLWLAHGVTTVRGVIADRQRGRGARQGGERAQHDRRAAHLQLPAAGLGWPDGSPNTPEKAREWVRWASVNGIDGVKFAGTGVDQDKADPGGDDRRGQQARPRHDDAPLAAGVPGGQRGRDRAHGARDRHALLRALRVAAQERPHAPVPGRLQLRRRAVALAPRGQGDRLHVRARLAAVVGLPERAEGQRRHVRPDDERLRGRP